MDKIERIALIGVGAIGAFMAPRLQATYGDNFRVIAGGERRARLDREGVTVNGAPVFFHTVGPEEETGPADLVIICVKSTALDEAVRDIRNQVGPDTLILSVLNGVDTEERVAAHYGWGGILYSVMRVNVVMEDHACRYDPDSGKIVFGERSGEETPRALAVRDAFLRAGINCTLSGDILHDMWFKFMANVGQNLTSALLGIPFGAYCLSEDADAVRNMAMEEVIAIAGAKGIRLGQRELDEQMETIRRIPPGNKPSTLQDIEAGRKTEIELLAGTVCRMGRELGIPTPVNRLFYHAIRVLEEKNLGMFAV